MALNVNKYILASIVLMLSGAGASAINIEFMDCRKNTIDLKPASNSGLENIYVVYDISDATSMRISQVSADLSVSRYGNMGGGYAEPVLFTWDGNTAVIDRPNGNSGYIFTQNGRNISVWIVDYQSSRFSISSVTASPNQDCSSTIIKAEGNGAPIYYYGLDGRRIELSRDIIVTYTTQIWDEQTESYINAEQSKNLNHLTAEISLTPPLYCSSEVTITGDRFLQTWGETQRAVSPTLQPNGLDAHTTAVQTNLSDDTESQDPSNVINGTENNDALGGSAPAVIQFTAFTTDAVIHNEWQMSTDPEFNSIDYRWNEREVEYSFDEEGEFYVRYIGSNEDGTCETYGETYTISIGSSELRIPNAFTPNDDGVNDVWKVAYRSLLDFKCWIFDRYGNQVCYFTNPDLGWDGRVKGKRAKAGVYYYVIEAKGSDGKKYKKGGDINLVDYKRIGTQVTPSN